ncbi:MAG: 2OG-Fe(II) oxygenase [Candidatus Sulfotelmatobacter sp.]
MTAKQILDAFSETLMQDERILSPRERELLMSLLQNSRAVSNSNPETQSAVTATIARSVGETVAQRAFALLGGSIVEQILARSGIPAGTEETIPANMVELRSPQLPQKSPQPPQVSPQPPQVSPQPPQVSPQPPQRSPQPPQVSPQPPQRSPQPPQASPQPPQSRGVRPLSVPVQQEPQESHRFSASGVEVLDTPALVRAQSVVLDEFLAPQELDELLRYALQRESDFRISEVISPSGDADVIDYSHRRSRVMMDLGKHEDVIVKRIYAVLPEVLQQLGMEEFPVSWVETQVTASNDGDFFRMHNDDGEGVVALRKLTFVYFFHGEPCRFKGGELRLHDANLQEEGYVSKGSYQTIVPQQNQIVFFPCSVLHEITPVECPSKAFADSRFTVNGWLRN